GRTGPPAYIGVLGLRAQRDAGGMDQGKIGYGDHAPCRVSMQLPEGIQLLEVHICYTCLLVQDTYGRVVEALSVLDEPPRQCPHPCVGHLGHLDEQQVQAVFQHRENTIVHRDFNVLCYWMYYDVAHYHG